MQLAELLPVPATGGFLSVLPRTPLWCHCGCAAAVLPSCLRAELLSAASLLPLPPSPRADNLASHYRRAMELEVDFFGAQPFRAPQRTISLLVVDL